MPSWHAPKQQAEGCGVANEWDNLPNARHIDAVLAHATKYPGKWRADRDAAWVSAMYADRAPRMHGAAVLKAVDVADTHSHEAVVGSVYALSHWDDAGDLLAMPVDAVRLLAACGHHPAVLLLPAVIALAKD
jgi:hypothetical protein